MTESTKQDEPGLVDDAIRQLDYIDHYLDKNWLDNDYPNEKIYEALSELRRQHAHIAEIQGQCNELVDSVCSLESKVAVLEHFLRVAGVKNAELQAQLEAIGAGGVEPLRSFHAAPAFSRNSSSKLNELLERGYRISGYSFERMEAGSQVTRGFIDRGGLVGWWVPDPV